MASLPPVLLTMISFVPAVMVVRLRRSKVEPVAGATAGVNAEVARTGPVWAPAASARNRETLAAPPPATLLVPLTRKSLSLVHRRTGRQDLGRADGQ